MQPFIHLHVHTQFSVLDGQASVPALVDKAIADGMKGLAITDHGNMFGIKEFFNYVKKKNGKIKDEIKEAEKAIAKAREENDDETVAQNEALIAKLNEKIFKPIFGCEMYVALKSLHEHVDKKDTGRHLIVLAKNETGYHNLIKKSFEDFGISFDKASTRIREPTRKPSTTTARDSLCARPVLAAKYLD